MLFSRRSRIFGLSEVSALQVQSTVGGIIPALPTTSSVVAGLAVLEVLKIASDPVLAQGRGDRRRRVFPGGSFSRWLNRGKERRYDRQDDQRREGYRNTYVDLSSAQVIFTPPAPPPSWPGPPLSFSIWDRMQV